MPYIGSRSHARAILDWVNNWHPGKMLPDGFVSCGSGGLRDVYLHEPSGVVYKVESCSERGWDNRAEVRNARALRAESGGSWRLGTHVRIPKTSGYTINGTVVVAMEYVEPSGQPSIPSRKELRNLCRFEDMHGANFLRDKDGFIVPIDMGSPRMSKPEYADARVMW